MAQFKTPLVSKFRTDSATLYTFGSAVEDIGLNINERNNKVRFSNYVLLNLPNIVERDGAQGRISIDKVFKESNKFFTSETYHDYTVPSMIQNYVLNFETRLRNQGTYDFNASQTVTEKVFWKWLQKTGAIKFEKSQTTNEEIYYHESFTSPDDMVIKGFGQVTTSSQSSNSYNMNNETYVLIPSSYGQMKYFLNENFDVNYVNGKTYPTVNGKYLEGYTDTSLGAPGEDFLYTAYTDNDAYAYKVESAYEGLQFEFDIKDIRKYIKNESTDYSTNPTYYDRITYDNIAIDSSLCLATSYDFNTILLYYTIYDKNNNALATNLFGIMVLDSTEEMSSTEKQSEDLRIAFDSQYQFDKSFDVLTTTDSSIYVSDVRRDAYKTLEIDLNSLSSLVDIKSKSSDYSFKNVDSIEIDIMSSDIQRTAAKVSLYSGSVETDVLLDCSSLSDRIETDYGIVAQNNTYYTIKFDTSALFTTSKNLYIKLSYSQKSTYSGVISINISDIRFTFDEDGVSGSQTARGMLRIPSYKKTKTNEGSFGSEYSFRVNMQTASIYDKNSTLIDYSTGENAIIEDFNGVVSNLKNAVDILTNNSVVLANMYTDSQGTKQLVANSLTKVDDLEKSVNDILYGNVREISAKDIDTTTLSADIMDTSLRFISLDSSIEYGKISGDTLSYQNIDASVVSVSSMQLSNVKVGNNGLILTSPQNSEILRIDVNGNIYIANEEDNLQKSIGRWLFIPDYDDDSDEICVYEILMVKNLDEIIEYIETESEESFEDSGLSYKNYLLKYWNIIYSFMYEKSTSEEWESYLTYKIYPVDSFDCYVITHINGTSDKILCESKFNFKEYSTVVSSVNKGTMCVYFDINISNGETDNTRRLYNKVYGNNTGDDRDTLINSLMNKTAWFIKS